MLCACISLCVPVISLTKATLHMHEPSHLDPHPAVIGLIHTRKIAVQCCCFWRLGSGASTECMLASFTTSSVNLVAFRAWALLAHSLLESLGRVQLCSASRCGANNGSLWMYDHSPRSKKYQNMYNKHFKKSEKMQCQKAIKQVTWIPMTKILHSSISRKINHTLSHAYVFFTRHCKCITSQLSWDLIHLQ